MNVNETKKSCMQFFEKVNEVYLIHVHVLCVYILNLICQRKNLIISYQMHMDEIDEWKIRHHYFRFIAGSHFSSVEL